MLKIMFLEYANLVSKIVGSVLIKLNVLIALQPIIYKIMEPVD